MASGTTQSHLEYPLPDAVDSAQALSVVSYKPAYNDGFNARMLRGLTELIEQRRDEIARVWDEFFGEG